jgi:hypothetical protein
MPDGTEGSGVTNNTDSAQQPQQPQQPADSTQTTQQSQAQPQQPQQQAPAQQDPGAYGDFTLPEGAEADPETMKEAGELFQSMKLTQTQAQQLIDFAVKKQIIGGAVNAQEMFEEQLNRKVSEWGDQTRAHPEFGGARLNESLQDVRRAIGKLGGERLERALSHETGVINHPEVWAAFVRMGRMLRESPFVAGSAAPNSGANSPQQMARAVYPNMR